MASDKDMSIRVGKRGNDRTEIFSYTVRIEPGLFAEPSGTTFEQAERDNSVKHTELGPDC